MKLPLEISGFKKYVTKPNAICAGTLYTKEVRLSVPHEKKRTLRVYLPEEYDGKRRFPVLYVCDAQNSVDRYTSAYGEWNMDERMVELVKEGYSPFIVVGCDCPRNPTHRFGEYVMEEVGIVRYKGNDRGYGKIYAKDIVNKIKPEIDRVFKTLPEKEFTGYGGSSMGGLFAFDIVSSYPDVFSFALCFSPAFFTLKVNEYYGRLAQRNFRINEQKFFLFSGDQDLDARILPGTMKMYKYLKSLGYDGEHNNLLIVSNLGHNEASWNKVFKDAIRFWNIKKED
ncbi:MAG: hypothetical protein K6F07_01165 [Bacilli bacterium]|nr:hypothetical protein [Bacilli bacterium]